jgi:hypothetical protein
LSVSTPDSPRPDQLEHLGVVEVLGPLTGPQPELPAVPAGHDRHERGGPVGAADLLRPVVDGERLRAVHVDDQPLLLDAESSMVAPTAARVRLFAPSAPST